MFAEEKGITTQIPSTGAYLPKLYADMRLWYAAAVDMCTGSESQTFDCVEWRLHV
jgi:hypothetical protein